MPPDPIEPARNDDRSFVSHLECSAIGERYEAGQVHGLSAAGKPLLVRYDLAALRGAIDCDELTRRGGGFWKYRPFLPVCHPENVLDLGEVMTPLVRIGRDDMRTGTLLVKDEGRLPTGSFKARGLALAVAMAKELGLRRLAMPTNGNAGAALAAYAARAGLASIVYCPADTPEINIAETALQGAEVVRVDGLIDDCGRLVAERAKSGKWFDCATLKEPYRIEGKKTMGLELAEQFGWTLPDVIFYPTGGGTGLIGMWKAFAELEAVGWIGPERPRMVAVQAEGCAPIVRAYQNGADHADRWDNAQTVAAGIRVPAAIGDFLILRAVRESGGFAIAVSDPAILAARSEVARGEGLLLCPEGAATYAAYQLAVQNGQVSADENVVLFNCASGLKYPLD
ncbi:MAG: threonine synthase [Alphaproteobacteria bacterium]|nr:threonine synthase [Alphaproteobacteria bacterium]